MPISLPVPLLRFGETVIFAAIGGGAAGLTGLPAGWLWGAFLAVMIAGMARRPVYVPKQVSAVTFVFLGMMLGGAVTPETLAVMSKWPLSIALLAFAMLAITAAVAVYLHYVHRWDWLSAVFAAAPGALSQSLALAVSTSANVRAVVMVQAVRIVIYTAVLPAVIGSAVRDNLPPVAATSFAGSFWAELAILIVACASAAALAHRWHIPGAFIVGSMLISGVLHGTGLVHVNPPQIAANFCFLLMGALVGTRFAGVDFGTMRQLAGPAFGALIVGTLITFGLAYVAAQALAIRMTDMFLAYVPGGLEAMSILAFALNLDAAFVGSHHLVRYVMLALLLPVIAAWLQHGKKPPGEI